MTSNSDLSVVALDHAQNPRNAGPLESYNGQATITGPCGDTMEIWLRIENGRVEDAAFKSDGCGTSLACGSMATDLAKAKAVEQVRSIKQGHILAALDGLPEEAEHCALLAANTLHAACDDFLAGSEQSQCGGNGSSSGSCSSCDSGTCSAKSMREGESEQEFAERQALEKRLCRIKHKVVVLSGKGGVGKSTVAVNLALSLAHAGNQVGILDVDIHGPSVPRMLGLGGKQPSSTPDALIPITAPGLDALKVMSIGFLLPNPDEAVIWRGPMKMSVIRQFLADVEWGDLDYLIIDSPPGTGDEPLSVCQLLENPDGAVVVTTPQQVATEDVRKSITFCRKVSLPVLGVVENMSGFVCPKCGDVTAIFQSGGGERMAAQMSVPFLGSIPIDPRIVEASDSGNSCIMDFPDSPAAEAFGKISAPILALSKTSSSDA